MLALAAAVVIGCSSSSEAPSSEGGDLQVESPNATATSVPPTATSTPEQVGGGTPSQPVTVVPAATDSPSTTDGFALLSTNGGVVNFGELRGAIPLVLFFYGGSDCTGCEDRLRELQDNYNRFKQLGAELIAVSTDAPEITRVTADNLAIEFPVLSDIDGAVARRWGLFSLLGTGQIAPAIYVFNSAGDEVARQIARSAGELPSSDEVLQTLLRAMDSGTAEPTATPEPTATHEPTAIPQSAATPQSPIGPQPSPASSAAPVLLGAGVTDFRLPDAISETEIALSDTLIERNVVLVFYRAFW